MCDGWICDWCLFPQEGEECPWHGPAAMQRLADMVRAKWEDDIKKLEADAGS